MAHCAFEKLSDLKHILDEIRSWQGIKELKPGIFYIKRKPFLHFHEKEGNRWADVRKGINWGPQIEIPFLATKKEKSQFLKKIKHYHAETCKALSGS